MDALQIIIVEDNLSYAVELEMLVEDIGYEVAGRADNSSEALELIFTIAPDLIMMDIDIKGGMSGVEVGEKINHLNIPILYITSFKDEAYYEKALKSNLAGYLVKPISKIELRSAIHLAMKNAALGHPKMSAEDDDFILRNALFFRKKEQYCRVDFSEILYIESGDKYCMAYTVDGTSFLARLSMNQMEALLPEELFMRVHRSYIIALEHVRSVNFFEGEVKVGTNSLPLSRDKSKQLREQIQWLK